MRHETTIVRHAIYHDENYEAFEKEVSEKRNAGYQMVGSLAVTLLPDRSNAYVSAPVLLTQLMERLNKP